MQIITWLAADDSTYQSGQPRTAADIAIPNKPEGMEKARYNRTSAQWEREYDTATRGTDLSLGEAEQLYAWAQKQGEGMEGILLKVLGV